MISVDPRAGSGSGTHQGQQSDLVPYLKKHHVPAQHETLTFGDVSFMGSGPEGVPVPVGIELKLVPDALDCMQTGRFAAHQLPGMRKIYQDCWLIIEGRFRRNPRTEILEIPCGKGWMSASHNRQSFTWHEFKKWQTTIRIQGGFRIEYTYDRVETAALIVSLYSWWQNPWDNHSSLKVFNTSDSGPLTVSLNRITQARRLINAIDGVGWDRSYALEKHFGSLEGLMLATPEQLAQFTCNGRKLGISLGKKIYEALRKKG